MAIAGIDVAIDHVTASVIQGAIENIAVEMGHKLMRMSYSSIIRESEDFGAALVDAQGRGLAESAQSTPLQSGPIPGYVRAVLRLLQERGDTLDPGDVIMHNDAYAGASHGPDVAFIVPVFHAGQPIAFTCTTAHHLDIGALSPGSCGIVDALLVAGEPVLRDGQFTRINKADVLAELAASLRVPLSPDDERRQQLARDIFPHVQHFYDGWLDESARTPFYRPSARS